MILAVCFSSETFTASVWTFKRLLSAMNPHMNFEVWLFLKRTLTARMWAFVRINPTTVLQYMTVQTSLSWEGFCTSVVRANVYFLFLWSVLNACNNFLQRLVGEFRDFARAIKELWRCKQLWGLVSNFVWREFHKRVLVHFDSFIRALTTQLATVSHRWIGISHFCLARGM